MCVNFAGESGQQLSSIHAAVPSLQLQLLLPGGVADWLGSGLCPSDGQHRTVSAQHSSYTRVGPLDHLGQHPVQSENGKESISQPTTTVTRPRHCQYGCGVFRRLASTSKSMLQKPTNVYFDHTVHYKCNSVQLLRHPFHTRAVVRARNCYQVSRSIQMI